MSIVIITGSGGLVGAESVKFFSKKFSKVIGIDNDMRAYFFGKSSSVKKNIMNIQKDIKNYKHYTADIRNNFKIKKIFKKFIKKIIPNTYFEKRAKKRFNNIVNSDPFIEDIYNHLSKRYDSN